MKVQWAKFAVVLALYLLFLIWLEKQGVRYVFHQDIFRASDEKLCLKATVELVCLINGRLGNSEEYDKAFEKFLK